MRRFFNHMIFMAAISASLVFAQNLVDDPKRGFSSFDWDSTYSYVQTENESEGLVPFDANDNWLWYEGSLKHCPTETGYRFVSDRLESGLVYLHKPDDQCFDVMFRWLRETYSVYVDNNSLYAYGHGTEINGTGRDDHWILRFRQESP